jgi:hypothetical protein
MDETLDSTQPTGGLSAAIDKSGKISPTGKVALDATQTGEMLANMQAILDERQGPLASFNRGFERAAAWGSGGIQGPSAALAQLNQNDLAEQKSTFDMRQQMAAYRAAQAQQERFDKFKNQQISTGTGGAPGAVNEATMPPQIRNALNNAQNQEQWDKIYNTWAQKQAEIYANPSMDEPKIPVVENIGGQWVRKTVSARDYRANQGRYQDTPQTQAAVNTASAPSAAAPNAPVSVRNNNPGNIVDPATGKIRTFATPAEGDAALEADLKLKLSGQSPIVKERFGAQVGNFMSPALLAETWAPSTAPGNTPQSTQNYGKAIADAVGVEPTSQIPNTPESLAKAKAAIAKFEAGAYPTTTPIATKTTATGARPTPEQLAEQSAIREAATKEFATGAEKGNVAKALQIDTAGATAPERVARFNDVIAITESPEMKQIFGLLAKKGFTPFALKQLENGVNAGQFGTMGIAGLERNLMEAGATPDQIAKLHKVEKHLAAAELEYAKTYLTGQGAVSDNERKLIKDAVGSVKDPAAILRMQASVMAERAEFDQKIKEAYDAYRDRNGEYAPFGTFMRSDAKNIVAEHNQKLSSIINKPVSLLSDPINSKAISSGEYQPGSIKWGNPKK